MEKRIPEDLKNKYPQSTFIRTLIKSEVHERLTEFAKKYSNGMDKWDYGVAIEVLLDFYDYNMSQMNMGLFSAKIDVISEQVNTILAQNQQVKEENKPATMELLGGNKEEI